MMKIILLGYMGSGKSTIAKLLSQKLKIPSLDLDLCIENETGMSVISIFETHGEIYFRKKEHTILKALVESSDTFVLALGGGTPCYANNHELLKDPSVVSIYLKSSIDTLCERLNAAQSTRPLIAGKSEPELKYFIAQHLFERSYYYSQSKFTVSTDGKSPQQITDEIETLLI